MKNVPDYAEFNNPRLVAVYNAVCPLDGYEKFYILLAKRLSAKKIIDIGCGTGLLTCELAKRGYQMVGVEPSSLMLDVARKSDFGDKVRWIQGDSSALSELDADLSIMTGHVAQFHIDEDYWVKSLRSIYETLRPGGHLAFESRNPAVQPWVNNKEHTDWYARTSPKKVIDPTHGQIEYWGEPSKIEGKKVTFTGHYLFVNTGEELVSTNTLIFRTKEEIASSLEEVGFVIENIYGNWDWSAVNPKSPEFIFVAKK